MTPEEQIEADNNEVGSRQNSAGCICGWHEEWMTYGTFDDCERASSKRFAVHVASGDCPEKRDADGRVITGEVFGPSFMEKAAATAQKMKDAHE